MRIVAVEGVVNNPSPRVEVRNPCGKPIRPRAGTMNSARTMSPEGVIFSISALRRPKSSITVPICACRNVHNHVFHRLQAEFIIFIALVKHFRLWKPQIHSLHGAWFQSKLQVAIHHDPRRGSYPAGRYRQRAGQRWWFQEEALTELSAW